MFQYPEQSLQALARGFHLIPIRAQVAGLQGHRPIIAVIAQGCELPAEINHTFTDRNTLKLSCGGIFPYVLSYFIRNDAQFER